MSVNILVRSLTASHFPHLPKQCDICHLDFLFSEAPLTTYTIWPYKLLLAMCPRQVFPNSIYKPQVTKAKSQSFTYKTQAYWTGTLDIQPPIPLLVRLAAEPRCTQPIA